MAPYKCRTHERHELQTGRLGQARFSGRAGHGKKEKTETETAGAWTIIILKRYSTLETRILHRNREFRLPFVLFLDPEILKLVLVACNY